MLGFMSVLSRYYFVFLIFYFLFVCVSFIIKEYKGESAYPKGLLAVSILLVVFAFPILSFDENLMSVDFEPLLLGAVVLVFITAGPFLARRFYKRPCPLITHAMFFLIALGIISLQRLDPGLAVRQLLFAAMGFGASLLIPLLFRIFREFEKLEKLYILICLGLISLVSIADILSNFVNIPIVTIDKFGASRWINIAGITFQPSEFVAPFFVIYLASAFRSKPNMRKLIFAGGAVSVLIGILVLQRNLGGALMYFMIFMIMLYAATGSLPLFGAGFAAMAAGSVFAYHQFAHVRVRVAAWSNPWADISGQGFQLTQSLFAIGTWGPFGAGLGRGLSNRIPVVERDVIFSAIAEEFGWIFALLLIVLYALILMQGVSISNRSKRPLYALMTLGFTAFLTFQAFVSIGGNIRLIPMTGITLPFVSYGGSSVFVSVLMIGVLNWLNGQINIEKEEKKEEEE